MDSMSSELKLATEPGTLKITPDSDGSGTSIEMMPGKPSSDGSIIFYLHNQEVLRFSPDGPIYIYGERVDDNAAVYRVFLDWLRETALLDHIGHPQDVEKLKAKPNGGDES
jgi:hypothetical protein